VAYFALMVPSIILTLQAQDLSVAREDISFNLSGPLTLSIAAVFFGQIDRDRLDRRMLLLALMGPILSIASTTLTLILTRDDVVFGTESSKAASAHFGPNQVSAVLGLAALAALFGLLEARSSKALKIVMSVLMVFLLIQSSLTYSRGGLYSFAGAALVACLCAFKGGRTRAKLIAIGLVLFALAEYVVIPRLDELTGGTLISRFKDTDLTGRDALVESELEIWAANPIIGVGPGQAMYHRDVTFAHVAAHTEFSRAVAEHGLLGAGSLFFLVIMIVRTLRGDATPDQKAFAMAGWAWSFLFMLTAGMRIVAPAFLVGLSATTHGTRKPVGHPQERYFRQSAARQAPVRQAAKRAG
jgi:O-antigen ligase